MKPSLWRGVAIGMESALGAALTVSSISNASPGVVGYTGTDPIAGEYVLLDIVGMEQLKDNVVRIGTVDAIANTFTLEGVDTTLFDTFISGTAQVITFGVSIGTVLDMKPGGGDVKYVPTTTIHQILDTQAPNGFNAATYTFENMWDVSDAGLLAMKAASDAGLAKCFKVKFKTGAIAVFNGYASCSMLMGGTDKVTTPAAIALNALPRYYAS